MTGDEHALLLEKVKARGTETDVLDEDCELEGEQTLVQEGLYLLRGNFFFS